MGAATDNYLECEKRTLKLKDYTKKKMQEIKGYKK